MQWRGISSEIIFVLSYSKVLPFSTFLIYTNICSVWSFSENCEMEHMQMHLQTLPRCTLSTPMGTLMETSISTRNFFLDFDDTISWRECLLLTVRMHAVNYNQMIFCATINKIWIVRKSLAKLAVTEEFGKLLIVAFTFKHKSKQNYSQRREIVITFLDSARPRTCFDMSTSSTQNPCIRNPFSFERFRKCWWMQNMTRYCVNEKGTSNLLFQFYAKVNF